MGELEGANPEWHNRALNMRKLTPVVIIRCLLFKNRLLFHELIFPKLIFNTHKGGVTGRCFHRWRQKRQYVSEFCQILLTKTPERSARFSPAQPPASEPYRWRWSYLATAQQNPHQLPALHTAIFQETESAPIFRAMIWFKHPIFSIQTF